MNERGKSSFYCWWRNVFCYFFRKRYTIFVREKDTVGKYFFTGIILFFSIGMGSLFLSGCVTTEYDVATHRKDIFIYSTEKEIILGENLARHINKQVKLYNDPSSRKRINQIGEKIAEVCDRKELNYYFYIINKDEKNAFSLPGGYVYIYKGLWDILDSDDELAFVLAHEIGHIVARHHIKKLQAALGYNFLMLATTQVDTSPRFLEGLSFALRQIMSAYSREDEFLADELATKYIKLAGFEEKAGIKVLNKLYSLQKKEPLKPFSYFKTHPFTAQRIRHIKEVLKITLDISDYINF
ncbi:MAG: hypothetical protein B6D55_01040 [Candidatus Omnitrophica bacterium 4484_70.2]|nr:MAG: hypothetical protein B6D55_01040 [Candidatus Omnitrophica bacterium 4484_70.2]